MPRNWAAEEREFARAEQKALDRLSALQAELQRLVALAAKTPIRDEVEARFDATKERIRHQDHRLDQALAAMK